MEISSVPASSSPVPSTTSTVPESSELGKDEFLKLLVTQLEYQDPMDPVSNEEFIAQTAQFSSLEQMQNLNVTMSNLIALERSTGNATLASYVGKTVEVPGTSIVVDGDPVTLGVELTSSARLTVEIQNSDGTLVRTIETEGVLAPDDYRLVWDGTDDSGEPLPEGIYYFTPIATDTEGNSFTATPFIQGKVTGVLYENNMAQLRVNEELVDPDAVRAVVSNWGG